MRDRKTDDLLTTADVFARERLSPKRYGHTLRVARTAEGLARTHGLDPARTRLAALLHDVARETPAQEFLDLADTWHLPVGRPERENPKLLHGPIAAEFARRELGVEDEEILAAVREHTTGRPNMTPLSLVLFVADKIEPARDYPSVERLRKLAGENVRAAALESLRRSMAHNQERGRPTHPSSLETLKWLDKAEHAAQ